MTREQMTSWIDFIKGKLRKMKEFKNASEEELNCAVLDGLYEGFVQGELHRSDLKLAADILGHEVSEDFMNDPHPDPIDLKEKNKK